MAKGLFILILIIGLSIYNSRPLPVPANVEVETPPVESQTPHEELSDGVSLSVFPESITQGDPVLVSINGLKSTSTIRAFKFHNEPLKYFMEGDKVYALIGIDLRKPPTVYPLTLTLTDGRVIQENVEVKKREIPKAPLGIPEKLVGNTPESEKTLINTLAQEGAIINAIKSLDQKLWGDYSRLPLNGEIVITDNYGYSRLTGASTISHKGTDFRATVGTPVYAINDGVVAFTGEMRNYGKTVVLDHGLGLLSIYMHLSEIEVKDGEEVKQRKRIGKSGNTGYVLGPHLHLTIRINQVSIDPEKFFQLPLVGIGG